MSELKRIADALERIASEMERTADRQAGPKGWIQRADRGYNAPWCLGVKLLGAWLATHGTSEGALARASGISGATLNRLVNGGTKRIELALVSKIEHATGGEVPSASWSQRVPE